MKSAPEIAKYIVHFFQERQDPVTNLKLQKLLYYVQGWHLALFNKPAFSEEIQAWVHGPVVPEVYREYKSLRWNPIVEETAPVELEPELKALVDEVLDVYGGDGGWELERRTHSEAPWLEARNGLPPDAESHNVISLGAMSSYFKTLA